MVNASASGQNGIGNTPFKGRRKQPQQSPGTVQILGNGSTDISNGNQSISLQMVPNNNGSTVSGQNTGPPILAEGQMIPTIPQSAVQSVTDNDDLASLKAKFKVLRRENL